MNRVLIWPDSSPFFLSGFAVPSLTCFSLLWRKWNSFFKAEKLLADLFHLVGNRTRQQINTFCKINHPTMEWMKFKTHKKNVKNWLFTRMLHPKREYAGIFLAFFFFSKHFCPFFIQKNIAKGWFFSEKKKKFLVEWVLRTIQRLS